MSAATPLTVTAAGLVCSVGLSAPAACAAIRGGLDNFFETEFVDRRGEPLAGGRIPWPDPDLLATVRVGGIQRLSRLFALAARECAREAGGIDTRRTALLLLGPQASRPDYDTEALHAGFAACEQALGRQFHPSSRILAAGNVGLVAALEYLRPLLAARTVQAGLVAGVDSLLNTAYINTALRRRRLLTRHHSDGLMPAEAAAVVLVRTGGRGIHIRGLGRGREANTRDQDRSSLGQGLAQAMDQALTEARCPAHLINRRYADLNGESYSFQEAASAWARVLHRASPPDHDPFLFAPYVGDVGAAIGPLCLAYALNAQRKFHSPGPWMLAHFSNTDHRRGALVAVQGD